MYRIAHIPNHPYKTMWTNSPVNKCAICHHNGQTREFESSTQMRCLSHAFFTFCDTSFGRHLSLFILYRIAFYLPPHHCMIHAVHELTAFVNMEGQRDRLIRTGMNMIHYIQSGGCRVEYGDDMDSHFLLQLGGVSLYNPLDSFDNQPLSMCRFDFLKGTYYVHSPDAYGFVNPWVNEAHLFEPESETHRWLLPTEPPWNWLTRRTYLRLRWHGEYRYLSNAKRVIPILALPGVISDTPKVIDTTALDIVDELQ